MCLPREISTLVHCRISASAPTARAAATGLTAIIPGHDRMIAGPVRRKEGPRRIGVPVATSPTGLYASSEKS